MFTRSRCIAVLVTIAALSATAGASAKAPSHTPSAKSHARVVKSKSASRAKAVAGGRATYVAGTTVVALDAFPTGGKGSGTEATCGLWADRLNFDQQVLDEATDKADIINAYNGLNADKDNALDAGCVVID
jgi:hypothetical protein